MVQSKFDTDWSAVEELTGKEVLRDGTFLWVINADRIPPHIGISENGSYFSLKIKGIDDGVSTDKVFDLISAKGISTLVVGVSGKATTSLKETFEQYERAVPGKVTCLHPIREYLGFNAETIHVLLDKLEGQGMMKKLMGLNLPSGFIGIPDYDLDQIHCYLENLEGV